MHFNYGRGISSIDARSILTNRNGTKVATTDFLETGVSSRIGRVGFSADAFLIDRSNELVYVADDGSVGFLGPSRAYGWEAKTAVASRPEIASRQPGLSTGARENDPVYEYRRRPVLHGRPGRPNGPQPYRRPRRAESDFLLGRIAQPEEGEPSFAVPGVEPRPRRNPIRDHRSSIRAGKDIACPGNGDHRTRRRFPRLLEEPQSTPFRWRQTDLDRSSFVPGIQSRFRRLDGI